MRLNINCIEKKILHTGKTYALIEIYDDYFRDYIDMPENADVFYVLSPLAKLKAVVQMGFDYQMFSEEAMDGVREADGIICVDGQCLDYDETKEILKPYRE